MNLKQRLDQLTQLQVVETPWEIRRVFGKIELHGDQVCFRSQDDNDYVTVAELRQALELLTVQLNGTIKWSKEAK